MGKKVLDVLGWHPKLCPGALSGRTPWWNILVSFPGSGKMVSSHFQEAEIQAVNSNFFLVETHTAPRGVWIPHQVLPMTSRSCFPAGHGCIWAFFRSNSSKSAALPKAKGAMGVCSLLPESLPVLRQLPGTNLPQGGALGTESSSWFADTLGGSDGKESACSVGDPWVRRVPPEKGMATHYSILARRIPWTEEPSGLQSTEVTRVGYDWVTNTFHFNFPCLSCEILSSDWITNPEYGFLFYLLPWNTVAATSICKEFSSWQSAFTTPDISESWNNPGRWVLIAKCEMTWPRGTAWKWQS